ncbi:hypothetical protein F5883DRAFT_647684 [Diaporthe sp. PMI_573]|nr:hypothetical protein F5883DRAFT_647684 [Diaporthaceae sp. PMI_573]
MTLESRSMAIAKAQATIGDGVDLWLVSATPIRLLEDFELPVQIFSNSSNLSRAVSMAYMVAAYTTARSSDEDSDTFWENWSKVFDSQLVLRNIVTSQFHGRAITRLQTLEPDRVWLDTPQEHFEDVQEVAYLARQVIRGRASFAKEREQTFRLDYASDVDPRLHFVSLFPAAASLIRQNELNVDEEDVSRKVNAITISNKLKVEKIESYQKHLEQVSRNSPKLDFILEDIGRMRADREERVGDPSIQATLRRENLSIKKMVIITPTLGTAVFLYLFLLKRVPDLNPVCFHLSASPSDREAALNSFQSLTARKNARHSYILITPFSTGGTGLNFQSANYQILVYPPSTRNVETQAFARTNRTGQRLALHHKVLIMQDNPADRINVVKYAGRSIRNDPFEMSRRLVLVELDGSKKVQRLEDWGYKVTDFEEPDLAEYFVKQTFPTIDASQFQACRVSLPDVDTLDDFIHFNWNTIAFNTMCVNEAWNDEDKRPRHEKLNLRDIILGIWVYRLNRAVRDLKTIIYCTVIEKTLSLNMRRRVYILMTEELTRSLVIRRQGGSPQECEAFDTLLNGAPFCVGAQKMLEEYSEFAGVQIERFEFDVPVPDPYSREPFFNFRIDFQ